jgi:hypothetical protein
MDRINPPSFRNLMIRKGETIKSQVISELGIYGVWISIGSVVHLNQAAGHLLRTKSADSDEGGVASGYAVLDSVLLV